MFPLFSFW